MSSVLSHARVLARRVLGSCSQALSTPPLALQPLSIFPHRFRCGFLLARMSPSSNDPTNLLAHYIAWLLQGLCLFRRCAFLSGMRRDLFAEVETDKRGYFSFKNSKPERHISPLPRRSIRGGNLVGCRSPRTSEHARCLRNQRGCAY